MTSLGTSIPFESPDPNTQPSQRNVDRFVTAFGSVYHAIVFEKHSPESLSDAYQFLFDCFSSLGLTSSNFELAVFFKTFETENGLAGHTGTVAPLALRLWDLGMKRLIIRPNVKWPHFGYFFELIAQQKVTSSSIDILQPFLEDGSIKSISLIPRSFFHQISRMADDFLSTKLKLLSNSRINDGPGFRELLKEFPVDNLPDFIFIVQHISEKMPDVLKSSCLSLVEAIRDGSLPASQFLKHIPLPDDQKDVLVNKISISVPTPLRSPTALNQSFKRIGRQKKKTIHMWPGIYSSFLKEDVERRRAYSHPTHRGIGAFELPLVRFLLNKEDKYFPMALKIYLRTIGDGLDSAYLEQAFQLGMEFWDRKKNRGQEICPPSLWIELEKILSNRTNVGFALQGTRIALMDSDDFRRSSSYLRSLGQSCIPELLHVLEAESDRGMRKKLCDIISQIVRQHGPEELVRSISRASPLLLRNIVMILGDLMTPESIREVGKLVAHPIKNIRVEAIRSLQSMNIPYAKKYLEDAVKSAPDDQEKILALEYFTRMKDPASLPWLIAMTEGQSHPTPLRRALLQTIGAIGGQTAQYFLHGRVKAPSMLGMINSEERKEQDLLKDLLKGM